MSTAPVAPPNPAAPKKASPEDRRTAARCRIEAEVGLDTGSNFYGGFAFDLSTGGLFVTLYDRFPKVGEEVDLTFTLPHGSRMEVKAVVRWHRPEGTAEDLPPGVGVQFLDLPEAAREGIERFVAGRDPIFFEG
jgi:uncharacterized protein (TIGR02266 family)